MDVTIVIPTLGKTKEQCFAYAQCLGSLIQSVPQIPRVVAVNGLKSEISGHIRLTRQGQCGAVNAAVATIDTEWILVTNDDMIFPKKWWTRLSDFMKGNPQIKCISPNLVEPKPGAPPFITYFCGGAGGDFNKEKFFKFADKFQDFELEEGFNLPFLMKKELWDLIGGYDVNYDPFGSNGDSDLQAKVYLAGEKTWRYRNCIVYHFSQTSGTFLPENRPYWQKNWDYFIKKWGFPRQGDDHKVWYSKDLIDYDKLIYHPHWEGFYVKT